MRPIVAIARHEFATLFNSWIGPIVTAVLLAVPSVTLFRFGGFVAENRLDMAPFFETWLAMIAVFGPAVTMRSFSEKTRTGMDEVILSMPVSTGAIVVGNFLGITFFLHFVLGLSLLVPGGIALLGSVDPGLLLTQYLGLSLVCSTAASVGIFVSSKTSNQIIAFVVTVLILGMMSLLDAFAAVFGFGPGVTAIVRALSVEYQLSPLVRGVVDGYSVVYFVGIVLVFLRLTAHSVESRRCV